MLKHQKVVALSLIFSMVFGWFPGAVPAREAAAAADHGLILHYDMKTTATSSGPFLVKDVAGNAVTFDGIFRNPENGGHAANDAAGYVTFNGGGPSSGSAYIEIPKGSDGSDVLSGINEVTVSTVVNWTNDGVNRWIFGFGTVLAPETNKYFFATPRHGISGQNPVAAGISKQGWPNEALIRGATDSFLTPGEWKQVTVTMSEATDTLALYVDGVKIASGSAKGIKLSEIIDPDAGYSGFLGKSIFTNDSYLKGSIADFRVYNGAFTDQDAADLFHNEGVTLIQNVRELTIEDAAGKLDMDQYVSPGDTVQTVTQNLSLPTTLQSGVTVAWTSSRPDIISNTGAVTRPQQEDVEVQLTATLSYQGLSGTAVFPVIVLKAFTDQQKADLDAAALAIAADRVKGHLRLDTTGANGSAITWTSSRPDIIKGTADAAGDPHRLGWVTRQDADTPVTLTANVTNGGASARRTFDVTVVQAPEQKEYDKYFFAYFTGEYEGGEEISFAVAEDPLKWRALNNGQSVLRSTMGEKGLRDPFVIRSPEGDKFYLLATDLKMGESTDFDQAQITGSHSIMIWESDDLVNWSEQRMVEVAPKNGGNTWAPEAFYDEQTGEYVVFWASSIKNEDTYGDYNGRPNGQYNVMYYATTRDFRSFSEPKVFIDESLPTIDTTMIKDNGTLYRFTKSEVNYKVYAEKAPGIYYDKDGIADNGFQYEPIAGTRSGNQGLIGHAGNNEGPTVFKDLHSDKWYMFLDSWPYHVRYATNLEDGAQWVNNLLPDNAYALPPGPRHGTVIPITDAEYEALNAKYGVPGPQPSAGPVVHYSFDAAQGSVVPDMSGNEHDAALVGGATINPSDRVGETGGSVELDGVSGYVELPRNLIRDLNLEKATFATWVKMDKNQANQRIFEFASETGRTVNRNTMYLSPRGDSGKPEFAVVTPFTEKFANTSALLGANYKYALRSASAMPEQTWQHVAVTIDGFHAVFYLNGVPVATSSTFNVEPRMLLETTMNFIGKSSNASHSLFDGKFDDFRIYNRALSEEEVGSLVNGMLPNVDVTGVMLNRSAVKLTVGASAQLTATVAPVNATDKGVTWSSDNEKVATVHASGLVTAVGVGKATVTVTTADGSFMDSATVTVAESVDDGLLLHYTFDETGGTTIHDAAGGDHNGTLIGGGSFAAGKADTAVDLNGTGAYIDMPDGIVQNLDAMTVSAWVNPDRLPVWSRVFDFGSSTTSFAFLTLNNGANMRLGLRSGGTIQDIDGIKFPETGGWQHIAVTLEGKTATLYLNGREVAKNSNMTLKPSDLGHSIQNYIGKSQFSADPYYDGKIDDFRIYGRALSGQEVMDLMAENLTNGEIVLLDKDWLDLGDTSQISGNMTLPSTGPLGSSITWVSSNPAIVSRDGAVTRPRAGSGDAQVTLTATISKGGASVTQTFDLVVWETGAVAYQIAIDAGQPLHDASQTLFGLFYEDINFAADGGLYGELVQNRSFEFGNSLFSWNKVAYGGGSLQLTSSSAKPLNGKNHKYATLQISSPGDGAGISNAGYTGIAVVGGESYDFSVYARTADKLNHPMSVELRSADDAKVYGRAEITGLSSEWNKFEATIASDTTDNKAKLVLTFADAATIDLDMVSLFPEKTWKNRKNGLRYDLAKMLDDMNPKFLRFPGGCIVEGGALNRIYRWKNTIGDVAERETQPNFWGYSQSFGLGYDEYFRLAEDIGAEPLPVIFSGIGSCSSNPFTVPMDQLQPYIDDALDLIEYANGDPESTEWGALRAKNGHPEPYHLKYLGVGNETWGSNYFPRYKAFYDAIKAKYPDIRLIVSAGAFPEDANYRLTYDWLGAPNDGNEADLVDEHMYQSPQWMLNNLGRYDNYSRSGPNVFVGEYAAHGQGKRNNMESALSEAAFMTGLERNSDVVEMASYAPLFSRRPASFTQWTPDMIWFDEYRAFGTPNYYVQQLFMNHMGDQVLPIDLKARNDDTGSLMLGSWATQVEYDNLKVTAEDGTVLYANDFSDPATLSDFVEYGAAGDWVIQNGVLKQKSLDTDVRLMLKKKANWVNCTIQLEAKKIAGQEGFLIGFGAKDFDNYYWYNLGGFNNTVNVVEKAVDGAKTDASPRLQSKINTAQLYNIKIEVNKEQFHLYLDENKLFDIANAGAKYPGPLYGSSTIDEETGDIIVKAVNMSGTPQLSRLQINGKDYLNGEAAVFELSSDSLLTENSFEQPTAAEPVAKTVAGIASTFEYEFPAHSVTIMRIRTKPGPFIKAIDSVSADTYLGLKPILPDTVKVKMSDGTERAAAVQWTKIDEEQYATRGVFEVEGIVEGTYLAAEAFVTVHDADTTSPTLSVAANIQTITPPNHKLVDIRVTLDAQDAESGIASVHLVSITSNEPDEDTGAGDFAGDIRLAEIGTADTSFQLRAERSGKGTGRIYTITYEAVDRAGNRTTASTTVVVPHSKKN
ncbi:hypothetical protein GE107_19590 [Cohnella sp. CFH 77786]|uniref:LamG-like jellyroll fold domain-containing protein n=1 Tax=Cohnella sp. CFH 77786 TaxID=2662265 RepID=UPI001C60974C|nr:LamG-like jellyroll fold domain-containing protein [Cohnella sp. CFH 77786]MBW5448253.1 hypothetical protein [Cohnella sp. CFH 77786]